jgi:hypothetical protein
VIGRRKPKGKRRVVVSLVPNETGAERPVFDPASAVTADSVDLPLSSRGCASGVGRFLAVSRALGGTSWLDFALVPPRTGQGPGPHYPRFKLPAVPLAERRARTPQAANAVAHSAIGRRTQKSIGLLT